MRTYELSKVEERLGAEVIVVQVLTVSVGAVTISTLVTVSTDVADVESN